MENICDIQKRPDPVKGKVLELIQIWSHAFRNEPSYKIVQDTYSDMKREGMAVTSASFVSFCRVVNSWS